MKHETLNPVGITLEPTVNTRSNDAVGTLKFCLCFAVQLALLLCEEAMWYHWDEEGEEKPVVT